MNVQDEYLQEEINNKGIIDEKEISFDDDIISIWQGDITTLKCDVIVNACNEYLLGCFNPTHRCIDNTIHSFAGMQLREECNNIMKGKTLQNGEVVLTNAYNLPSRYIVLMPNTNIVTISQKITNIKNEWRENMYILKNAITSIPTIMQ